MSISPLTAIKSRPSLSEKIWEKVRCMFKSAIDGETLHINNDMKYVGCDGVSSLFMDQMTFRSLVEG